MPGLTSRSSNGSKGYTATQPGQSGQALPADSLCQSCASLQSKWWPLLLDISAAFVLLEEGPAKVFLLALLDTSVEKVLATLQSHPCPPHAKGGTIGIPNPTTTGGFCLDSSQQSTKLLQESLVTASPLCASTHCIAALTGRHGVQKRQTNNMEGCLAAILKDARPMAKRRIIRLAETMAWLTTLPHLLNSSNLSTKEFRDGIQSHFGLVPMALPHCCVGCGTHFATKYIMSCHKGGLILQHHNNIAAEWGQLCKQALTPSTVSDKPPHPNKSRRAGGRYQLHQANPELSGGLAVHSFWVCSITAIFDICVTNMDSLLNCNTALACVLERQEKKEKDKYTLHHPAPNLKLTGPLHTHFKKKKTIEHHYDLSMGGLNPKRMKLEA
jgi:hypothetical protein